MPLAAALFLMGGEKWREREERDSVEITAAFEAHICPLPLSPDDATTTQSLVILSPSLSVPTMDEGVHKKIFVIAVACLLLEARYEKEEEEETCV